MTSPRIVKYLSIYTALVCLTTAAAFALSVMLGSGPATYAAMAAASAAIAWWFKYAFGVVLNAKRLQERICGDGGERLPRPRLLPEYEEVAREVESGRMAARAMLRTCYSIVAAINDTESVSLRIKRDFSGKMGELDESVSGLRGTLVTLREMKANEVRGGWLTGPAVAEGERAGPADGHARVQQLIDEISVTLEEMSDALREVHHDARELLSSTGETSYSVSRLDSFLQEMVRSGKDLESSTETASRVTMEGIKVIDEMQKENAATIASVKKAANSVSTLGMWSKEIGKIIQVIKDIADETNLLALNVAIIASQAGEHGKAFGVVAEEIRGLAERTSSSTKEISDLITTVQSSVSNVMEEMKESVERVERGEVLVANAGKVIDKISESFESTKGTAHQITTKTAEHRMDSSHAVRAFQNVAEIARRIEVSKPASGAVSGRGATAAQTLKVLTQVLAPARREQVPAPEYAAVKAPAGTGISAGAAQAPTSGSVDLLERGIGLLDGLDMYVQSLRSGLSAYFEAVSRTASLIRSIAGQLHIPSACREFVKCWEEFDHAGQAGRSCPAYGREDWRCFLSEDVDRRLCGDEDHEITSCYTCPVFRQNMERLIPDIEREEGSRPEKSSFSNE